MRCVCLHCTIVVFHGYWTFLKFKLDSQSRLTVLELFQIEFTLFLNNYTLKKVLKWILKMSLPLKFLFYVVVVFKNKNNTKIILYFFSNLTNFIMKGWGGRRGERDKPSRKTKEGWTFSIQRKGKTHNYII